MKFSVGMWLMGCMVFYGALFDKMVESSFPLDINENVAKYEVIVKRYNAKREIYLIWSGAILNTKFVLTVDVFEGKEEYYPKDMNIVVGYHHIARLNESMRNYVSKKGDNFLHNRGIYEVENSWKFLSLLLIQTKTPIIFDEIVRAISLPTGEDLSSWKNPFLIPNRETFSTSYWCRREIPSDYYLYITKQTRSCTMAYCIRENGLIPSCIPMRSFNRFCILAPGAPLVYSNILVGLRKRKRYLNPKAEFMEDYFINLAPFKETIDRYIKGTESNIHPAPTTP